MLTVKLNNGNECNGEDRIFYINDLYDVKRLQDNILEEFQKVLEQEKSEDRITLERLVDAAGCSDEDELEDWIRDAYDVKDALDSSDYDSVDEMTERIDELANAVDEAYEALRYVVR